MKRFLPILILIFIGCNTTKVTQSGINVKDSLKIDKAIDKTLKNYHASQRASKFLVM